MSGPKLKKKYNKCKLCGAIVVRGVLRCPGCQADIIDQHGVHAFIFGRSDNAMGALVGFIFGWVPSAVIVFLLADPSVGYLDLSEDPEVARAITYGFPVVGLLVGWFWAPIRRLIRGE